MWHKIIRATGLSKSSSTLQTLVLGLKVIGGISPELGFNACDGLVEAVDLDAVGGQHVRGGGGLRRQRGLRVGGFLEEVGEGGYHVAGGSGQDSDLEFRSAR